MFSGKNKCLSEIEVGAYIEGTLSSEKRDAVEQHFADCSRCWNEFIAVQRVITLKSDLAPEEVPEGVIRSIVKRFPQKSSILDIVLKLAGEAIEIVRHSADFSVLEPLPAAGVRGKKEASPKMVILKRTFDGITVELNIEKIQENLCNIRVMVEEPEAGGGDIFRVELMSRGRVLFSSRLEQGEAVLEDVGSGEYRIRILRNDGKLGDIVINIQ